MNVKELKEKIKADSIKIKAAKKELRQNHKNIDRPSYKQMMLSIMRFDARVNLIFYAFLRGKRLDSQEKNPISREFFLHIMYQAKTIFDESGLEFFKQWLLTTHEKN